MFNIPFTNFELSLISLIILGTMIASIIFIIDRIENNHLKLNIFINDYFSLNQKIDSGTPNLCVLCDITQTDFYTVGDLRKIIKDVPTYSPLITLVKYGNRLLTSHIELNMYSLSNNSCVENLNLIINDEWISDETIIKPDIYIDDFESGIKHKKFISNKNSEIRMSFFKPIDDVCNKSYILITIFNW